MSVVLIDAPPAVLRVQVDRNGKAVAGVRVTVFQGDGSRTADVPAGKEADKLAEALCPPEDPVNPAST